MTEQEAQEKADKLASRMVGKASWHTEVWYNDGWYYGIFQANGHITIHESCTGFHCALTDGHHPGLGVWRAHSNVDPNVALHQVMMDIQKHVDALNKHLDYVKNIVSEV